MIAPDGRLVDPGNGTCQAAACPNYASDICCKRGVCGGEKKNFDPQPVRRLMDDGVTIEDFTEDPNEQLTGTEGGRWINGSFRP
jgi:hypothetical protein